MTGPDLTIHRARFDDLENRVLHDVMQLRSAVFVVEQDCVFLDLDGRDQEPEAEHLWIVDRDRVVATLRILRERDDEWSVGRVVTRADARSRGLASALMRAALERLDELGARQVLIGAQAHLADWYARFGFETDGASYVEDGIPHVPMRRVNAPR